MKFKCKWYYGSKLYGKHGVVIVDARDDWEAQSKAKKQVIADHKGVEGFRPSKVFIERITAHVLTEIRTDKEFDHE